MNNTTSEFLGTKYLRWNATVKLEDVQPLFGGVRLTLDGSGQARVEQVERDGQTQKYRFYVNPSEVERFWQLCIEQDFLTIQPEERPGLPDEARPIITLRNRHGQEHTISKWVGVEDAPFEAIYRALLAIVDQSKTHRPIPKPRPVWPRALIILGLILLAVAPIWPANLLARQVVNTVGAQNPFNLVRPLLLLVAAVPLLLGVVGFLELRAGRWRRFFWRDVSLLPFFIALLFVITLCTLPTFLIQAGLTRWGTPTVAIVQTKTMTVSLDHSTDTPIPETIYTIRYSFQTDAGETYTRSARVRQGYYNSVDEGDTVTVYYLPAFPRLSRIEAATDAAVRATYLLTALFTLIIWLIGLGVAVYGFWPLLKRLRG